MTLEYNKKKEGVNMELIIPNTSNLFINANTSLMTFSRNISDKRIIDTIMTSKLFSVNTWPIVTGVIDPFAWDFAKIDIVELHTQDALHTDYYSPIYQHTHINGPSYVISGPASGYQEPLNTGDSFLTIPKVTDIRGLRLRSFIYILYDGGAVFPASWSSGITDYRYLLTQV